LRCAHCYLGDKRSGFPEKRELTKDEIFGILDQVTDAGTLWFLLTGGEPFLRPDFLDIYRYTAHKGLIPTIFTNGTLLTQRIVDQLADLPPQLIEITLYGRTEATYERITGVKGSFARCMRGIDMLLERGLPLKLKTIVMQWNRHELEDMQAFAASLGVGFRYDSLLIGTMDNSSGPFQLRLSPEEVVALEKPNLQLQKELRAMLDYRAGKPVSSSLYKCGAALNTFHIDPYGQLYPCMLSRVQSYDLRIGDFSEGWDVFLQQVRSLPAPRNERCDSCSLQILCAQCPGKSNLENGQISDPVEYFCQVGRLRAASLGSQTH
jgi:radical SAM protein with 4Fe4S-binding SPASM domain